MTDFRELPEFVHLRRCWNLQPDQPSLWRGSAESRQAERQSLIDSKLSPRVRPLFLVECVRTALPVWPILPGPRQARALNYGGVTPQHILQRAEKWVLDPRRENLPWDGTPIPTEDVTASGFLIQAAYRAASSVPVSEWGGSPAHPIRALSATSLALMAAIRILTYPVDRESVLGNVVPSVEVSKAQWRWYYRAFSAAVSPLWNPAWNSSTAIALARGIFQAEDFSLMPILADALQDAGCDHDETLARLRDPEGVFTRADCCLWQLMGLGSQGFGANTSRR